MAQYGPPIDVEEADPLLKSHRSLASLGNHDGLDIGDTYTYHKLFVGASYLVLSTGMIIFNKHLMGISNFPFASFIALCHTVFTFTMAGVLILLRPDYFPGAEALMQRDVFVEFGKKNNDFAVRLKQLLLRFFPIGALGAINLVLTTSAYNYNNVSELQMVKETGVVMVYTLSCIAGMEVPKWKNAFLLISVSLCAMLAVCGAPHMAMMGLMLQLIASICQSAQIVLSSCMMTQSGGPKIDPLTMVLCSAPAMLCVLIPINYHIWDPLILVRLRLWWPQLLASSFAAFLMQVVTAIGIRELSATGMQIVAVTKDLGIVGMAAFLLHEHLTNTQMFGFVGAVASISVYSWMRLKTS